jgi:uncharacterized protein YidB (DUF937 family)
LGGIIPLSGVPAVNEEIAMGMFDSILGGFVGVEMANAVNHLIEQHGGVAGIVGELQSKGLGEAVKSWISTGPNQPVSPSQLHQALGPDVIQQLAAKTGLNPQDLLAKLSTVLPTAIDKLTPGGVVPRS